MIDRPTGSYTHERLIALEDSHKAMTVWIEQQLAWLKHIRPNNTQRTTVLLGFDQANKSGLAVVDAAYKIREEAGL